MTNLQPYFDSLRPPIEAQLLAEFISPQVGQHLIEIGCGNGFISLYLAANHPDLASITGVDIETQNIHNAQENLETLTMQYPIKALITFIQADARTFSPSQRYDWLLCNPPFFAENASRPSPNISRRHARQDQTLTLSDLFSCANRLLQDNAKMVVVLPGFRKEELNKLAKYAGFDLTQEVHHPNIRKRNGGMWVVEFGKILG